MKFTRVFAFMALAGLAGSAFATNGMFSHGYGMKSKGMAGASYRQFGRRFWRRKQPGSHGLCRQPHRPRRRPVQPASRSHDGRLVLGRVATVDSESNYHLIPEFGYNRWLATAWRWG